MSLRAIGIGLVGLLLIAHPDRAHAACDPNGAYHVVSKTRVGNEVVKGLVVRTRTDGQLMLDVVTTPRTGPQVEQTTVMNVVAETSGRSFRLRADPIPGSKSGFAVRLRLRPNCQQLVGSIRRTGKATRRIAAVPAFCGDGSIDRFADEDCEKNDTATCGHATCTNACICRGPGGVLDGAFGRDGQATFAPETIIHFPCNPGSDCARVAGLLVRDDGGILVTGLTHRNPGLLVDDGFLFRLGADGTRDETFGETDGFRGLEFRLGSIPGGDLAIAHLDMLRRGHTSVQRVLPDGGWVTPHLGIGPYEPHTIDDIAGHPDGDVSVLGDGRPYRGFMVLRWSIDFPPQRVSLPDGTRPVALDAIGRILTLETNGALAVRRFTSVQIDGILDVLAVPDTTFGEGSIGCLAPTADGVEHLATLRQRDGSFLSTLLVGTARRVIRIPPDGSGLTADCKAPPPSYVATGIAVARQADGKYLLLESDGSLRRLLADGSADTSFGRLGRVALEKPITAVALDADDRILVGLRSSRREFLVQRLLP